MKISVVIPTYRRPQLLCQCLSALRAQSFEKTEYEIIVVSDGPDRSTEEFVRVFKNENPLRVRFLSTARKRGPAAARNIGWLSAKGTLIAFTDDDTIPDKDWLLNIWKGYQGEDLVAFTGRVIVPVSTPPTDYEMNILNLETAEFVTANCTCTKKALLKTGGFDERFRIAWREDSDLHFKLLENDIPIMKINAIVIHPVRKAPWGVSISEQKKGIFNALLYKKYPKLYRQRIKPAPMWNYYLMIIAFLMVPFALLLNLPLLSQIAGSLWLLLVGIFAWKRLSATSRSFDHVMEMIVTSVLIPFLSVYWQHYGAWKYRVLFL
ncbi:MAG TPA: glycosyltransferase [Sphingobacteriaceae bacterium]